MAVHRDSVISLELMETRYLCTVDGGGSNRSGRLCHFKRGLYRCEKTIRK